MALCPSPTPPLLEVDFVDDMLHYFDPSTGELIACPIFVSVLPFSGYGYVEALSNAKLPQVAKASAEQCPWIYIAI